MKAHSIAFCLILTILLYVTWQPSDNERAKPLQFRTWITATSLSKLCLMSTEDISENTHVMIAIIYFIKANFMAINAPHLSFCTKGQLSNEERIQVAKSYPQTGSVVQTQRKLKAHFKTNKQKSSSHKCAKSVWTPSSISLQWLQQDGAHTLPRSTMVWLNERMGDRIISQRANVSWPPHSPDLSPLDFYL